MAKVEKDFLERKNPTERNFKAKPFMPRKPIPDLGHEKLDGKRFYTQDFMQKEWDSIWKKLEHFIMFANTEGINCVKLKKEN